jgi:hypothetical protein
MHVATANNSVYIIFSIINEINEETKNSPEHFELYQNYPNPFNPTTRIKYTIPSVGTQRAVSVLLKVYDILGNEVSTLVNEVRQPGVYEVEFSNVGMRHASSTTNALPSGVYFYQLKSGSFIQTKKMILLR